MSPRFILAAFLLLVLALVLLFFGGDLLVRFLGPPAVTLEESYAEQSGGPSFDHALLDHVLKLRVDESGLVDYAGLEQDPGELDSYLQKLAQAPLTDLGRNQRLALLINAYNAFTLRLILDHWSGGALRSIQDIPKNERWKAQRWNLGGQKVSLEQIENERIRPHFKEPRIHFALVCAARGCPPLRREAYLGPRLEQQLKEQALRLHADARWFQLEQSGATLRLTSLYRWYGGDFEQVAGSVLQFAARSSKPLAALLAQQKAPSIAWLDYDWSLNRQG